MDRYQVVEEKGFLLLVDTFTFQRWRREDRASTYKIMLEVYVRKPSFFTDEDWLSRLKYTTSGSFDGVKRAWYKPRGAPPPCPYCGHDRRDAASVPATEEQRREAREKCGQFNAERDLQSIYWSR